MKKINRQAVWTFVKYAFFAASAGIIQVLSHLLFSEVFHWYAWLAYFVSLLLSVLWNFTLNRKFTFHSASSVPIAMVKVACYYLVFTPLSLGWTYLLCDLNGGIVDRYIVEVVTMLINFATEFVFQKYFVFNDKKKEDKNEQ